MREDKETNDAYGRLSVAELLDVMSKVDGEIGVEFVFAGCHFSVRDAQTYKFNGHSALEIYGEKMHEFNLDEFKVPDGWKLVPLEQTCYQVLVGRNADSMDDEPCVAVYLAMLAAAPEYKP